jgi:hypothetical protein
MTSKYARKALSDTPLEVRQNVIKRYEMENLRKQIEIDFLKTKTYDEINDMFNQLNDIIKLAAEDKKELLEAFIDFAVSKGYFEGIPKGTQEGLICKFLEKHETI